MYVFIYFSSYVARSVFSYVCRSFVLSVCMYLVVLADVSVFNVCFRSFVRYLVMSLVRYVCIVCFAKSPSCICFCISLFLDFDIYVWFPCLTVFRVCLLLCL